MRVDEENSRVKKNIIRWVDGEKNGRTSKGWFGERLGGDRYTHTYTTCTNKQNKLTRMRNDGGINRVYMAKTKKE